MPAEPERPLAKARPFRPPTPVVIGILGGIAAGKSAVAGIFAEHGLRHVDADAHARLAIGAPEVQRAIAATWPEAFTGDQLDRGALARIVFADEAARRRLEALLHPAIRTRIAAELATARADGTSVLLDAPLLLEGGLIDQCDHVVFVQADTATRERRASARGWAIEELRRREAAQAPLSEKAQRAQHRIDNDGDLDATRQQVADLLDRLASPAR